MHHHHQHHLQHFLFHSNCLFHLSHSHRFLFVACCIDHINHIAVAWTLDCNHIVYVCIRSLKSLRFHHYLFTRIIIIHAAAATAQQQQQNNNRRRRHDATIWTTHSTEYTMVKLRWIKKSSIHKCKITAHPTDRQTDRQIFRSHICVCAAVVVYTVYVRGTRAMHSAIQCASFNHKITCFMRTDLHAFASTDGEEEIMGRRCHHHHSHSNKQYLWLTCLFAFAPFLMHNNNNSSSNSQQLQQRLRTFAYMNWIPVSFVTCTATNVDEKGIQICFMFILTYYY